MTTRRRIPVYFAGLSLLGLCSALASKQPPSFPLRDAVVEYRQVVSGLVVDTVQIYYSSSKRRERVIDQRVGRGSFALQDDAAKMMYFVLPGSPPSYTETPLPEIRYIPTRQRATVAGLPCKIWQAEAKTGPNFRTQDCLTADGLLLRSVTDAPGGGTIVMEATSVSYGPQDPALFVLPQGAVRR